VVKFHSPAQLIMPTYDVRKADHRACSMVEKIAIPRRRRLHELQQVPRGGGAHEDGRARPIDVMANGIDLELFDEAEIDRRARALRAAEGHGR
jgi:hypothetical protein